MRAATPQHPAWSPAIMRRLARHDDDGFALPSVIVIFAIVVVLSITLAGMAVHAVGFSTATRASVQSRAAADSGINDVEATMSNSGAPLANRLPCAVSHSYNASTAADDTSNYEDDYSVTVAYWDADHASDAADADALSCTGGFLPISTTTPPVLARITSTGTAIAKGVAGQSSGDTSTVTALVSIDVATTYDNAATVDDTVFSDGGFTIANGTTTIDPTGGANASIYSNGNVVCSTGGTKHPIEGSIYAQGNVELDNPCNVRGSVWAGTFSAPKNPTEIGQNLIVYNQQTLTLSGVAVDGSVVSNHDIVVGASVGNCSAASTGCGSVTSFGGTVTVDSGDSVAGDVQASGNVSLSGNSTAVYGNVRSTTGSLSYTGTPKSSDIVGGYAAVAGSQGVPLGYVGEPASTCGASGSVTTKPCPGGAVSFDASQIPTAINYPTNATVPAPPKESLPAINSDSTAISQWVAAGWPEPTYPSTCALPSNLSSLTGKVFLIYTNCGSNPLSLSNVALSADLVIMSQSGFSWGQNGGVTSADGHLHTFQAIVPSDGLQADGKTPLMHWVWPDGQGPDNTNYHQPVCDAPAPYGDFTTSNHFTTDSNIRTFIYTPCALSLGNNAGSINGEMYVGSAATGNAPTMTYYPIDVPGALATPVGPGVPTTTVTTAETSRFDTKG